MAINGRNGCMNIRLQPSQSLTHRMEHRNGVHRTVRGVLIHGIQVFMKKPTAYWEILGYNHLINNWYIQNYTDIYNIYINTYIYTYIYTYYNIISTTVSFNVCKFPFPKNMSRFPCLKSHEVHPIHPHLHRPGAGPGHHSAHPRRWRPCRRSFSGAPSDFHGNWRYKAMGFPLL